jgi:hypothetical protein
LILHLLLNHHHITTTFREHSKTFREHSPPPSPEENTAELTTQSCSIKVVHIVFVRTMKAALFSGFINTRQRHKVCIWYPPTKPQSCRMHKGSPVLMKHYETKWNKTRQNETKMKQNETSPCVIGIVDDDQNVCTFQGFTNRFAFYYVSSLLSLSLVLYNYILYNYNVFVISDSHNNGGGAELTRFHTVRIFEISSGMNFKLA